ncbi:PREDICTED: uncharacterized protein LOC108366748 [Rhagoletis zephyria]|uniref:uncharacterized protein LOC108366748 n=1 Tax=Rhagoletis zephyria TaxID=28612 RepID=UPI00081177D9|nr:PREDICTED: uncharacterized protein LOC108366748 [Rhagoletis zephyria]
MMELINLFSKLSEFYDRQLLWENIEEIYEKDAETDQNKKKQPSGESQDSDDEPLSTSTTKSGIINLPFLRRALNDPQVLATLLELSSTIRNLRGETSASYDNTYDCWDEVVKVSPRDAYLSFVYALAGLPTLDLASAAYTKLALAAVNTYFLSLTIPGAKGFHIFEPEVIAHCLQVFTIIERIQQPDVVRRMSKQQPVEIWIRFHTLCDDLKLLLRYVHFSDHKTTRDLLLKKLIDILYMNHERGYANVYAANLHAKCFEIFEEIVNAHNGEPEETLMKLMNMTVFVHTYAPKPKSSYGSSISGDCEHISDWFIKCISKYPRILVKVLSFYIECIVTNPIKSWKTEQTQRALEYAAKYDAALFTKCNESTVEFLCDAVYADEVMIRSRAIDLMSRILQLESQVDWQMFRHEISDIPREVHLINELIKSLQDCNNTIKLKAVQALHISLTKGSPNTLKILTEGIRYTQYHDVGVVLPDEPRVTKNEIRYEKPTALDPKFSYTGHGLVELAFLHLPEYVYKNLFQSPQSYMRRAGVMFMEQLAKLNPLIIFNTNFVAETTRLVDEPTALVRKQTLLTIDGILGCYPNCYAVIWVWCKIVAPMLRDADPKNVELAMDCFRSRVLVNMRGIDQSNQAEHFMPWVIIRTMLSTQPRLYLQMCFHMALQQRMLNPQMVSIIESHLLTSNSTEAWIVLNFISGKIKSKEPDALVHLFTSLKSWNKEQNMLIALEVLANCIQDFSHSALNHAFTHILSQIQEGQMIPVLIGKAFDLLIHIDNCSQSQACQSSNAKTNPLELTEKAWLLELHDLLELRILSGIADFPDNRTIFMSHLYSYSEVNLQTRLRPHRTIVSFIHKYMSVCLKLPECELDLENERLFNSMILIAGRLSLRDAVTASISCTLYGAILKVIDRPPIVNTIIVSLTDLCKKHTQIVERIIEHVLAKLSSPYLVNRIETFKCFEKLVLQDQIKLRGSLLLALMATILDDNVELAMRACEFFAEYLSKKNATLFQKCLVECPFVFNEYEDFDGLDSFSDTRIKSPLKGEEKRKSRQLLYNHLMASVDQVNLVLYFGQLKLICEKSQRDSSMKSAEGIALIKDVLFILKRVCQLAKEQKPSAENKDDDEENTKTDDALTEANEAAASEQPSTGKSTTNTATSSTGRGRGRRRAIVTMPDALVLLEKSLIFIPTIYGCFTAQMTDDSLQKAFDDLGFALAKRFPNLVQYAQPSAFWKKYSNKVVTPVKQNKKNKKAKVKSTSKAPEKAQANSTQIDEAVNSTENDVDADDDMGFGDSLSESDHCSDDDLPLASSKRGDGTSPQKRPRLSDAELPMEYLFNPNI